ncbi:hypothetical protein FB451DRAFT_1162013 [Mycena latifolia]|nr:hypothetical protein FB451DRAFT_1162013 [Mycena latifolia]
MVKDHAVRTGKHSGLKSTAVPWIWAGNGIAHRNEAKSTGAGGEVEAGVKDDGLDAWLQLWLWKQLQTVSKYGFLTSESGNCMSLTQEQKITLQMISKCKSRRKGNWPEHSHQCTPCSSPKGGLLAMFTSTTSISTNSKFLGNPSNYHSIIPLLMPAASVDTPEPSRCRLFIKLLNLTHHPSAELESPECRSSTGTVQYLYVALQ